jgi:hypothetical protein
MVSVASVNFQLQMAGGWYQISLISHQAPGVTKNCYDDFADNFTDTGNHQFFKKCATRAEPYPGRRPPDRSLAASIVIYIDNGTRE